MYQCRTMFSIAVLLPILLASALPHSTTDITTRAPSALGKTIQLNLVQAITTGRHGRLPSPLTLVKSDDITDDESVLVYDVANYTVTHQSQTHPVVARTLMNGEFKSTPNVSSIMVGIGHDGVRDKADRRWWTFLVRPYQPHELFPDYTFILHWKETQDSTTDWQIAPDLQVSDLQIDASKTTGFYLTHEWRDPKTGERRDAEVITKSDGSEMTPAEVDRFRGSRQLLAYGFEATTERYIKRWWLVIEYLEPGKDTDVPHLSLKSDRSTGALVDI